MVSKKCLNQLNLSYPIDSSLSFSEYINRCRTLITENRMDLNLHADPELIINTNSPFELYPNQPHQAGKRLKYGALLIHGLFDCPFSLRDTGLHLQKNGILVRSILLPGHGITPGCLLNVSYHDWIRTVRYGVETLAREVEQVFLVGFSTGATLALYHALQDQNIAGIIHLSPAIKLKMPVAMMLGMHNLIGFKKWIFTDDEIDYGKYRSISYNAVWQLLKLTNVISELTKYDQLSCPLLMIVSHEDETISADAAIQFFTQLKEKKHQLILYSAADNSFADSRILLRKTKSPDLNIEHFSHISLPFSPENYHYGIEGDYPYATRFHAQDILHGAYNRLEVRSSDTLYQLKMLKFKKRELTFNLDFAFMIDKITQFILNAGSGATAKSSAKTP